MTADPDLFYADPSRQAACEHLAAGIEENRGLLVLTGDPGTGKTTVLRRVLAAVPPRVRHVVACHVLQSFDEILTAIAQASGVPLAPDAPDRRLAALETRLVERLETGHAVLVWIDEAQALSEDVLARLPALARLGAAHRRLIQLVLVGHSELSPRLAGLPDGIASAATCCHLEPLARSDIGPYIRYRLGRAGLPEPDGLFSRWAVRRVATYAEGVPRVVNQICDNALRIAHEQGRETVSPDVVEETARQLELAGAPRDLRTLRSRAMRVGLPELGVVAAALLIFTQTSHPLPPESARPVPRGAPAREPGPQPIQPPVQTTAALSAALEPPVLDRLPASARPPDGASGKQVGRRASDRERLPPASISSPAPDASRDRRPTKPAVTLDEQSLLEQAEAGDAYAVRQLLAAGVAPDVRDADGLTALIRAAIRGHVAVLATLIAHGAEVNARTKTGTTALMAAAINNRSAALGVLLGRRADPDARTEAGWTALMYAAWKGNDAIARRLLDAGADATLRDKAGWTASQYAAWRSIQDQPDDAADAVTFTPRQRAGPGPGRYTETLALLQQAPRRR